jgi:hypothetical protein
MKKEYNLSSPTSKWCSFQEYMTNQIPLSRNKEGNIFQSRMHNEKRSSDQQQRGQQNVQVTLLVYNSNPELPLAAILNFIGSVYKEMQSKRTRPY